MIDFRKIISSLRAGHWFKNLEKIGMSELELKNDLLYTQIDEFYAVAEGFKYLDPVSASYLLDELCLLCNAFRSVFAIASGAAKNSVEFWALFWVAEDLRSFVDQCQGAEYLVPASLVSLLRSMKF